MKGKLIKTNIDWLLVINSNQVIGSINEPDISKGVQKLSIKNCEAIERGYDLFELAENTYREYPTDLKNSEYHYNRDYQIHKKRKAFIKGFNVAVEILGDKKFSINEVVELCKILMSNPFEKCGKTYQELTDNYIQSLQQTEFDVEIQMEYKQQLANGYKNQYENVVVPKLDADGCLILKRK